MRPRIRKFHWLSLDAYPLIGADRQGTISFYSRVIFRGEAPVTRGHANLLSMNKILTYFSVTSWKKRK
tara:strand:+ start:277 stop:480 length:204 start_codon:yes stop_codon:yes gene_type:complete